MRDYEKFRGQLVVFEGPDHSGKTTIAKRLVEELNDNGVPAIFSFQPGDPRYGDHAQIMHDMCKTKKYTLDPLSNLFAFLLDRSEQTIKVIKPHIDQGYCVISDRWWHSTVAYQFYGKQLKEKFNLNGNDIENINSLASHYIEPDEIFYMNRPQEAIATSDDDEKDIFETAGDSFKKRVKEAYEDMRFTYGFNEIQVSEDIETTMDLVIERMLNDDA